MYFTEKTFYTLYFFDLLERNYTCFFSFLFIGKCTDSIWQCLKWKPINSRIRVYKNLVAKIHTGLRFLFQKIWGTQPLALCGLEWAQTISDTLICNTNLSMSMYEAAAEHTRSVIIMSSCLDDFMNISHFSFNQTPFVSPNGKVHQIWCISRLDSKNLSTFHYSSYIRRCFFSNDDPKSFICIVDVI